MIDYVVSDGTIWGSEEWYQARWDSVPDRLKEMIVAHLRNIDNLKETKNYIDESSFGHFSPGMSVRNYLRKVVKDEELPLAPYPGGMSYQNWDDYYMKALEAAINA